MKRLTGLAKGEAIERTLNERFASLEVGDPRIPIESIVFEVDRGVTDYFGSESTPELTVGRLVRIAIALPALIESVDVDGHLYVDGGIVELLPARPILRDGRFEQIDAADHRPLRGPAFYDLFIDRSRWPALISEGCERTTRAVDGLHMRAPPRPRQGRPEPGHKLDLLGDEQLRRPQGHRMALAHLDAVVPFA